MLLRDVEQVSGGGMRGIYITLVLRLLFGTRIGQILVVIFAGTLTCVGFLRGWPMTISRLALIAITIYAIWRLMRQRR